MILGIFSLLLEAVLVWRARAGRFLWRFPIFYSYVVFIFVGSAGTYATRWLWPQHYVNAFWIYFMVTLVAEFAVLMEISDHIFFPYHAIRSLGRFVTVTVSIAFFIFYVLPALLQPGSSRLHITEFVKRSSLTKAVIIVCLLLVARSFDLPMSANTSGMMAGLGLYLASNIINFELLARLGGIRYGMTFALVGPVSFTFCLLVWTVALWRYEPTVVIARGTPRGQETLTTGLLGRLNNSLSRLLRK